MTKWTLVEARHLEQWATTRPAQARLPHLIRWLVRRTTADLRSVRFPSGELVVLGGWDGYVEAESATAFVPQGTSGWELSVRRNIKRKATEDYANRTPSLGGDAGEVDPEDASFVFATACRFPGKEKWSAERERTGPWKQVRVYDSRDLEEWLEQAPAAQLRLAEILDIQPRDVATLTKFWEEWSHRTEPALVPELLTAGRLEEENELIKFLKGPANLTEIQAETREEAIAFTAATLKQLPSDESFDSLDRAVVVNKPEQLSEFAAWGDNLLLIPAFSEPTEVGAATRRGHHVVVPAGSDQATGDSPLKLSEIEPSTAEEVLTGMGFPDDNASQLAMLVQRSLKAFQREITVAPSLQQPDWAQAESAAEIIPALLAGSWTESHDGDCEVLARIHGAPYSELSSALQRWSQEPDPPVRRIGDVWVLVSREDAWRQLRTRLTRTHLAVLDDAVSDVLQAEDPQYELPAGRQWVAGLTGDPLAHSAALRKGLCDTLVFLACRGEGLNAGAIPPAERAARTVSRLLRWANEGWQRWASLSRLLPRLAEAAPDLFLDGVETGLTEGTPPPLSQIFRDSEEQQYVVAPSSPHTGLLWALETLAWNEDFLPRVALCLAELDQADPGGKLANRPRASLETIFIPWHPQTTASMESRLRVLHTIYDEYPKLGWSLFVSLAGIPRTQTPTPKPKWRDWLAGEAPEVTHGELDQMVETLLDRLLTLETPSIDQSVELLELVRKVGPELVDRILAFFQELPRDELLETERQKLSELLRKAEREHEKFADASWAISEPQVGRLREIRRQIQPEDFALQNLWLFSGGAAREFEGTVKERDRLLRDAQEEFVRTVHEAEGVDRLLGLTDALESPSRLGFAAGYSGVFTVGDETYIIGAAFRSDKLMEFATSYATVRTAVAEDAWIRRLCTRLLPSSWSSEQKGVFLSGLSPCPAVWEQLEEMSDEVKAHYWRRTSARSVRPRTEIETAVRQILCYGDPANAVAGLGDATWLDDLELTAELVLKALEELRDAEAIDASISQTFWDGVGRLLKLLDESDDIEEASVAGLEWYFLPALRGPHERPKVLDRELTQNPEFFAEVVRVIVGPESDEDEHDATENEARRAETGWWLLQEWKDLPGYEEGELDEAELRDWVTDALAAASEIDRARYGAQEVGKVLSRSPHDGEVWPHPAVAALIQELANADLELGFEMGRFNQRAVVSRAPDEGGGPERSLATRFGAWATHYNEEYPRVARVLRRLEREYQSIAESEDLRAQQRRELES